MGFMAYKLKSRVQIRTAEYTPNSSGGADQSYTTLSTIWCNIKPLKGMAFIEAIRGTQIENKSTHEFTVRYSSVESLGDVFTTAYSSAFAMQADINPIKSDYFLFLESGSTVKGRLFKIRSTQRDDYYKEFLKIQAEEIEEQGTGYPI